MGQNMGYIVFLSSESCPLASAKAWPGSAGCGRNRSRSALEVVGEEQGRKLHLALVHDEHGADHPPRPRPQCAH